MKSYLITDLDVADNIVRLRKSHGWTQEYLSIQLQTQGVKISRSRLSMIELKRLNIPVSMLVALKIIFGCDYSEFFKGLEEQFPLMNEAKW